MAVNQNDPDWIERKLAEAGLTRGPFSNGAPWTPKKSTRAQDKLSIDTKLAQAGLTKGPFSGRSLSDFPTGGGGAPPNTGIDILGGGSRDPLGDIRRSLTSGPLGGQVTGGQKQGGSAAPWFTPGGAAPLDWRTRPQSPGAAGLWEGLAGSLSDLGRGHVNGMSDVLDWILSRDTPTKSGSALFGNDDSSRPNSKLGSKDGKLSGKSAVPGEHEMTLADYLAMAAKLQSQYGGGGPDYSAVAEALRQQALQGDAKLSAMYKQLQGAYAADAPVIQGQYDTGIGSVNQNADQAVENTNAGYQSARDAQTQQLAALGIGDTAAVLAGAGGNAAADQAHQIGNIEQNRATGTNQLAQGRTAALGYNHNIGNAAQLGGAEARSTLQRQLQSALAEIAVRQSEAQAQRGSSVLDLAFQLQDRDLAQRPQAPDPRDQQALAEFMYEQQNDTRNVFLQLVKQYDGDTQAAAEAYAQMQAAGLA